MLKSHLPTNSSSAELNDEPPGVGALTAGLVADFNR
jgi:hypothetical protein